MFNEIEMPLHSEILPGLWQGGTADEDTVFETRRIQRASITKKDFDTVITAYAWANPCDWGVKEVRYCFYDSDMTDVDLEQLHQVAEIAHNDWKAGKRVLIRCQLGVNRSGLLMATLLIKHGFNPREAISLIREKRSPFALSNGAFVRYLQEWNRTDRKVAETKSG